MGAENILVSYNPEYGYNESEINRIGNSIIYLSNSIQDLSKTKLLKLIYLIDETSVKKTGIPFFNLKYKVWQAGPVNVDLYSEFSQSPTLLKDFIELKQTQTGECYITAKGDFKDDEFSDNDLNLLNFIIKNYGDLTASKLVSICHSPSTLWYQIAKEKGLLEPFSKGNLNTTDFYINLADYIKDDNKKSSLFFEHTEFLSFSKRFK